jgi:methyltransferase (TIGR00027 family)
MKDGTSSRTAEIVCAGRAVAHGHTEVARYSDPTAFALLSPEGQRRVERFRAGEPRSLRDEVAYRYLDRQSKLMVVRTVAIDDAIREAAAEQVVILGAGLDGRAWRMAELASVTVYEVDHPDTQRQKRARISALAQQAHEVRFVAVDFTRDSLDDALARAGHDASKKTTWIWEGVVMYLTPEQVRATLAVIAKRSAPRSRLALLYHRPQPILFFVGPILRWIGEPLRSRWQPEAMKALLDARGFDVVRDDDMASLGAALGGDVAAANVPMKHLRLAIAHRRG